MDVWDPNRIWPAAIFAGYVAAVLAMAFAIGHFWLARLHRYRIRWKPDLPGDSPGGWETGRKQSFWKKLLMPRNPDRIGEYAQLLLEAGIPVSAPAYLVARRTALIGAALASALAFFVHQLKPGTFPLWTVWTICGTLAAILPGDKMWIGYFARRRSGQIAGEMQIICRQLMYFSGSRMSLHARLMRCTPFARRMRRAWVMLIHEWYEDPGEALLRFRLRVGTADAHGFAETLNAIRQNEYDGYYELLQRRIRDFKARMELARESRRESFSHVLFVLAGVPILNTFRVFVHPWVEAGRRMFESLQ